MEACPRAMRVDAARRRRMAAGRKVPAQGRAGEVYPGSLVWGGKGWEGLRKQGGMQQQRSCVIP